MDDDATDPTGHLRRVLRDKLESCRNTLVDRGYGAEYAAAERRMLGPFLRSLRAQKLGINDARVADYRKYLLAHGQSKDDA